jgi:carbonic anhydrase/acetyltransferase-like protein (isoleucine patch superfamily)
VTIGPGAVIGPYVRIGAGTKVDSHALVTGWTRIGRDCHLHHGAAVGGPPQDLKYSGDAPSYLEVGDRTVIREFATLNLATEPGATTRVGSGLPAHGVLARGAQLPPRRPRHPGERGSARGLCHRRRLGDRRRRHRRAPVRAHRLS